ncbi:Alpha-(1,3)-fucosyltransferase 9 [Merluccius polli]|uniref:Fucosyltransferase n=1 Tax=Merluccius polli TaxID=89951 RepID=A0AA47N1H6_MERPO|nr:Alpha-(1,3)-fucosyltransferase 9 [Merluccius polli]
MILLAGLARGNTGVKVSWITTPLSTTFSAFATSSKKMTMALFIQKMLPKTTLLRNGLAAAVVLGSAYVYFLHVQTTVDHCSSDAPLVGNHSSGGPLPPERYYQTMESCKFYLAFENSVHRDYFTEKVNGPLSSGTVPIVLGPTRDNYEDAEALAHHLLDLDQDHQRYLQYFRWRRFYSDRPHLLTVRNVFTQPTCLTCDYLETIVMPTWLVDITDSAMFLTTGFE